MLSMIVFVLKWIGIVLGGLLGLIILLLLILLTAPVRYKLTGFFSDDLSAIDVQGKATFLFPLCKANISYKNQVFEGMVRVLFKKMPMGEDDPPEEKVKEKRFGGSKTKQENPAKENEASVPQREKDAAPKALPAEIVPEAVSDKAGAEVSVTEEREAPETVEKAALVPLEEAAEEPEAEKRAGIFMFFRRIKEFFEKLKAMKRKTAYTFRKFCDTMTVLSRKKELVTAFLESAVHKEAWRVAKTELIRFFKHCKPRKFRLNARMGFEDPCLTGQVLAVCAVIFPLFEGHLGLVPEFETKVLQGELYIKGHFRLWRVLLTAWNLYRSKYVRRTYKDFNVLKEKTA